MTIHQPTDNPHPGARPTSRPANSNVLMSRPVTVGNSAGNVSAKLGEMVTLGDKIKAKRVAVPCVEVGQYGRAVEKEQ